MSKMNKWSHNIVDGLVVSIIMILNCECYPLYRQLDSNNSLSGKKKRPNPFGPSVLDELSTWKKLHLDLDLQLLPDHLTVDEAAPPLQALYGVHG